jgi:EEF1A N-terminal glycine/lysine methyltransferase
MDAEDILSDSLETLYDYTPITHSSAGSAFTYSTTVDYKKIEIALHTPDAKPANWSLHASCIWVASLYLADHSHLLCLWDQEEGEPLRVLELGAGAGCPGILIAKTHGRNVEVTLSDYPDDDLIASLKGNVERNVSRCSRARVVPYIWGSKETRDLLGEGKRRFDVVIAADTLWNAGLHSLFLDSLEMLLERRKAARVYLVAGLHTGRYTIQAFLDLISERGVFSIEELVERRVKERGAGLVRQWKVDRDGEDEMGRRDWVVWLVLKWTIVS